MANVGDVVVKITANTAQFVGAMSKVQSSLQKTSAKMTEIGTRLSLAVSAPLAAVGATAIKTAGEFQTSMNRVKALTGATGKEFQKLNTQAMELGRTTQFTARDAAGAMGFMAQAGKNTVEIYKAMPSVLTLAASAQLDMAQSADIVTNIMSGFNQEADELPNSVDVLVKSFTSANTNLSQLAQALKFVGPVANAAGQSFEETSAALSLMGNAGLQATLAGTGLRGILSRLAKPSKEAQRAMDELGVSVKNSKGELLPLSDIVEQFELGLTRMGGTAANTGRLTEIFGQRSQVAMQTLVSQGSPALRELTRELQNAGGTAQRIADVQMEGFAGASKRLQSALEGLQISIGNALMPTFLRFSDAAVDVISMFTNMDSATRNLILSIAGIAIAVGPVLLAFGLLLKFISPFAILTAAIIGIGAAAFIIWKNWEEVAPHLSAIWEGLKADAADWLNSTFGPGTSEMVARWAGLLEAVFFNMRDMVLGVASAIGSTVRALFNGLGAIWQGDFDELGSVLSNWIANGLLPFINTLMDMAERFVGAVWDLLPPRWKQALSALPPIVQAVWDAIRGIFSITPDPNFIEAGKKWEIDADKVMSSLLNKIVAGFTAMASEAINAFNAGFEGTRISPSGSIMESIGLTQFLEDTGEKIRMNLDKYAQWIANFLEVIGKLSPTNLLGQGIGKVVSFFTGEAEAAVSTVNSSIDQTVDRLRNLNEEMASVADGIGGGKIGDLDPFGRGISSAGQQNPVLGGSLGTVKQEFPIRQATEFELALENITADMKGIGMAMQEMQRFEGVDLLGLPPREQSEILADFRDMQTAITMLWGQLKDDLDGTNKEVLVEMLGTWQEISNELVGNSIIPDMWVDIKSEFDGGAKDITSANEMAATSIADSWRPVSAEVTGAIGQIRPQIAELSNEMRLFGEQGSSEELKAGFDIFTFIEDQLVSVLGAQSKTLPPLLNALRALKQEIGSPVDISLDEEIQEIPKAVKDAIDSINQLELATRGFAGMGKVLKDVRDEFDMIAAQSKVLGSNYDALGAEIRALEQALIELNLAQIQGTTLTEEQMTQMGELEDMLEKKRGTKAAIEGFRELSSTIKSSMRESLKGVLRGTQSIGDAFKNMGMNILASLQERMIEKDIDMVMGFIEKSIIGASETGAGKGSAGLGGLLNKVGEQAQGVGGALAKGGTAAGAPTEGVAAPVGGGIGGAMKEGSPMFEGIGNVMSDLGDGMMSIFEGGMDGIGSVFDWFTSETGLGGLLGGALTGIGDAFNFLIGGGENGGGLMSIFEGAGDFLGDMFDGFGDGLGDMFGGFKDGLGSLFEGFLDSNSGLGGILDSTLSGISGLFGTSGGGGFLGGLSSIFGGNTTVTMPGGGGGLFGGLLGGGGGGGGGGIMGMFGGGGGGGGIGSMFGGGGGSLASMFGSGSAPAGVAGPTMANGGFFSGGGFTDMFSGGFGFAKGGIMSPSGPLQLRSFAAGGVASQPTLAMFGEGSQNEAFVPLPDGKSIPVEMKGAGGVNVTINIATPDVPGFKKSLPRIQAEVGAALSRSQLRNT